MNCERIREQIPEAVSGQLDASARDAFVEHLESCAACRAEVAQLNAISRGLDAMKGSIDAAPDPAAKARFQSMLAAYQAGLEAAAEAAQTTALTRQSPWWRWQPVWQFAAAVLLVAIGVFAGRTIPSTSPSELAGLRSEVESLHQMVALSMLQQQSPSARMRGVSYTEKVVQPDPQLLEALLQAVNHDSNINVRLSAVDALQKFARDPEVARAMIDSIPGQESPLVQIALIDMLVQLRARSIAADLGRLAADAKIDEMVRQRAAWAQHNLEAQ
jgi:hypothetical protein